MIENKIDLINYIEQGNQVEYLFFWKHQTESKEISRTCLSQWYRAEFSIENQLYLSAEHFMMASKARLFGDFHKEKEILKMVNPYDVQSLGQEVTGFDEKTWEKHRFDIVIKGNLEKFKQNEKLKKYLLETKEKILVEASPHDKIWGVGLQEEDSTIYNPYRWKGLNLLGFALMKVRSIIFKIAEFNS
ncbi:MAG: NADAR family protein [Helicobacteraceae bacterium]|nr:NADAR family protein [Helicobacteraceae bacterium]